MTDWMRSTWRGRTWAVAQSSTSSSACRRACPSLTSVDVARHFKTRVCIHRLICVAPINLSTWKWQNIRTDVTITFGLISLKCGYEVFFSLTFRCPAAVRQLSPFEGAGSERCDSAHRSVSSAHRQRPHRARVSRFESVLPDHAVVSLVSNLLVDTERYQNRRTCRAFVVWYFVVTRTLLGIIFIKEMSQKNNPFYFVINSVSFPDLSYYLFILSPTKNIGAHSVAARAWRFRDAQGGGARLATGDSLLHRGQQVSILKHRPSDDRHPPDEHLGSACSWLLNRHVNLRKVSASSINMLNSQSILEWWWKFLMGVPKTSWKANRLCKEN